MKQIKGAGMKVGVAVKPNTTAEEVRRTLSSLFPSHYWFLTIFLIASCCVGGAPVASSHRLPAHGARNDGRARIWRSGLHGEHDAEGPARE